jgi:L-alanine-DL-glutamate epimerase-like enolase superfamily enzyme
LIKAIAPEDMQVKFKQFSLPFKYPFTISRGTKTHQPTLVVELEHFGLKGYGEAPAIAYYHIPVEKMIADLESRKTMVEKFAFSDPERYWHYLHHLYPQNSFLVCALDIAAWDLFGKLRQQPLYKLWNTTVDKTPVTDYTIGIDTIQKMVAKMKEKPWPIYKIKLGTAEDIQIVRALREHTNAILSIGENSVIERVGCRIY